MGSSASVSVLICLSGPPTRPSVYQGDFSQLAARTREKAGSFP